MGIGYRSKIVSDDDETQDNAYWLCIRNTDLIVDLVYSSWSFSKLCIERLSFLAYFSVNTYEILEVKIFNHKSDTTHWLPNWKVNSSLQINRSEDLMIAVISTGINHVGNDVDIIAVHFWSDNCFSNETKSRNVAFNFYCPI